MFRWSLNKTDQDPLRPAAEPAASIYDAFCLATKKRGEFSGDSWIAYEREAILEASKRIAVSLNLRSPSLEDVIKAENNSLGSADYGAKWARGVADVMTRLI